MIKNLLRLIKIINKIDYNNKLLVKNNLLNSKILSNKFKKKKIDKLKDVEWSCYSQFGEDGIISWIISLLPDIPKISLEFGVDDYFESNTRLLVENESWKSFIIESDKKSFNKIKNDEIYWKRNLNIKNATITKENINKIILDLKIEKNIGILSIDIDGNDYWVWKAINCINPIIVICEYNSIFGDKKKLTIPYNANFSRSNFAIENQYFGSSLQSLINLAEKKGYVFLGTPSTGVNCFFIKNDFSNYVLENLKEIKYYKATHNDNINSSGQINKLGNLEILDLLKNKNLFDLDLDKIVKIENLIKNPNEIFSNRWIK